MLSATALSIPLIFSLTTWSVGLRTRLPKQKLNVVPPNPDRVMAGMAQGSKTDFNHIRVAGIIVRNLLGRLLPPKKRTSQLGTPLEGIAATGVGEEVPLQEVVTPKPSKGITKNDNYFVSSVQTQDL